MAYAHKTVNALYQKLLALYPRGFRERLGESMEQTFHDLCNEQKQGPAREIVVISLFAETAIGIVHEHLLLLMERDVMKNMLANPTTAAITSFILSLPLGLLRLILGSDIEPLVAPVESMLTVDGTQPNSLGYTIICGGMLLLPVAFVLNIQPMLKREGPEQKRRLHAINLIVGAAILLLIMFTWGALIVEEIYCLRGIRCD